MRVPRAPVYPSYAGIFGARDGANLAKAVGARVVVPAPAMGPAAVARVPPMASQRAVFPRDWGLQTRMLATMFLLGLLYVGFVAALGAKEVSPEEAPGLHAMIDRLCIQADLPKPKIAVADMDIPNAFAMGRSKKSATVCATTGIMRTLSPAELEGVMAHELSHVKHRDVLIMTIASFFASLAAIMLQFGFFFGGDDDENPSILVVLLVSARVSAPARRDRGLASVISVLSRENRARQGRRERRVLGTRATEDAAGRRF